MSTDTIVIIIIIMQTILSKGTDGDTGPPGLPGEDGVPGAQGRPGKQVGTPSLYTLCRSLFNVVVY